MLLAGFFNLLVVAVAAPLLGLAVRPRRRDLPSVVARDYAGTALLCAVTCGLVVGGLLHRSAVYEEHADRAAAMLGVHDYVVSRRRATRRGWRGRTSSAWRPTTTARASTGPSGGRCACSSTPTSGRRASAATRRGSRTPASSPTGR